MTEFVEGDWKDFNFRMIQPSDHEGVLLHLRNNFYRDEPLCRHAGYEEEMAEDFDNYIDDILKTSGLNFMAVDKATNKIAGVRISTVVKKSSHEDPPDPSKFKSKKTGPIIGVLVKLSEDAKVFERYPEIEQYVEFIMVSVDKSFRGFGLASEIYERAIKMLTAMEFPLIKCVFSSPYTQRISKKRGFKELCKIRFLDWKDEKGERYYPNSNEEECAILGVKELKSFAQP